MPRSAEQCLELAIALQREFIFNILPNKIFVCFLHLQTDRMEGATQRNHVARQLEQALAAKAALQQERVELRHKIATSPKKMSPKKPAAGPQRPLKHASIPATRDPRMPAQQQRPQAHLEPMPEPTAIMAFRPQLSTESEARLDQAIAKGVANMLQTAAPHNTPARATRIVSLPAEGYARAEQASPLSPLFLTSKRRNMHCELDEPGLVVPYPRHSVKRHGFFARLFSCFREPPEVFPPSPYKMQAPTSLNGVRPGSGRGVSPPTLKLASEMEPLRQSLASLRPCLAADALKDDSLELIDPNDERSLRRAHRRLQLAAGQNGSMAHQGQMQLHPAMRRVARDLDTHSESSFESLEAERSDGEVDSPFGGVMYRRTPIAGPDGRPLVQLRKKATPEGMKNVQRMDASAGGNTSHAMAMQAALFQAMAVPLPPAAEDPRARYFQPHSTETPASDIKQTQVSLAELMGPGRGRRREGSRARQLPRGRSALRAQERFPWEEEEQPRGRTASRYQSEEGYSRRNAAKSAGPPVSRRASFQQQQRQTRHVSASPSRHRQQAQPQYGQQQQKQYRTEYAEYRSAPASPQRRTSSAHQQQQEQRFEEYMPKPFTAGKADGAKSAPASRSTSPLRAPLTQPRMNKASQARTEATQRLLESRRKREAKHLGHPARMPKRKEAAPETEAPAKLPRSAEKNQDIDNFGFILPPAGTMPDSATPEPPRARSGSGKQRAGGGNGKSTRKGLGTRKLAQGAEDHSSDPAPPRSPAFYRMLERLALGMSVDVDKVEAAKRPTRAPISLEHLIGDGDVTRSQPSRTVLVTPNVLFSAKEDMSAQSADELAQRLVSMTDAVGARGNDSCSRGSRDTRDSHRSRGSRDTRNSKDSHRSRRKKNAGGNGSEVSGAGDSASDALLGQLLDMERSLTLDDLDALRQAIRKEGGAAVAYAE